MKKVLLLTFLISTIQANEFVSCNQDQTELLTQAIHDTKSIQLQLINDIQESIDKNEDKLSHKIIKKLYKAKSILKCSNQRMEKLYYRCQDNGYADYYMKVFPIFGNEVKVSSKYIHPDNYNYNYSKIVGTLTHEATHKCGTNDSRYLIFDEKPESTWYSSWSNIASTYGYWVENGFCIPEVDC